MTTTRFKRNRKNLDPKILAPLFPQVRGVLRSDATEQQLTEAAFNLALRRVQSEIFIDPVLHEQAREIVERYGTVETYDIRTIVEGESYQVSGPRGVYTVHYLGSGDADPEYFGLWSCSCPASRTCKHIQMVADTLKEY
jgi:hypothetical protein